MKVQALKTIENQSLKTIENQLLQEIEKQNLINKLQLNDIEKWDNILKIEKEITEYINKKISIYIAENELYLKNQMKKIYEKKQQNESLKKIYKEYEEQLKEIKQYPFLYKEKLKKYFTNEVIIKKFPKYKKEIEFYFIPIQDGTEQIKLKAFKEISKFCETMQFYTKEGKDALKEQLYVQYREKTLIQLKIILLNKKKLDN